jgi:hypothetical protein
MTSSESVVTNPYATSPGSSSPGPSVTTEEGVSDLWAFTWFSVVCTGILAVVAVAGWLIAHR